MPARLDRRQTILLRLLDSNKFQRASELLTKTTVYDNATGIGIALSDLVKRGLVERTVQYEGRRRYAAWRLVQNKEE